MEANKKKGVLVSIASVIFGILLAVLGFFGVKFVLVFYSLISIIPLLIFGISRKGSSKMYKFFFLFAVVSNMTAWIITLSANLN